MSRDDTEIADNQLEYTNTSRVIYKGPCIIRCIMLAGDGANVDCQVYDGVNAQGKMRAHIEALSGTTFHFDPPGGVLFRTGLYIAVNAANAKVTLTLAPVSGTKV